VTKRKSETVSHLIHAVNHGADAIVTNCYCPPVAIVFYQLNFSRTVFAVRNIIDINSGNVFASQHALHNLGDILSFVAISHLVLPFLSLSVSLLYHKSSSLSIVFFKKFFYFFSKKLLTQKRLCDIIKTQKEREVNKMFYVKSYENRFYNPGQKVEQWTLVTEEFTKMYPSGRRAMLRLADGRVVKAEYQMIVQVGE
jgi:hypothetical protein